jgi:asparagine synthase (glutamine-hydrolysing)
MCGIVGLIGFDAPSERSRAIVGAMNEKITHRGPDGHGLVDHIDATLAMRRLAIVDIEHGKQPMANEDGSIVLVYNGEVYNAPALRRSLEERGVRFRTRSDTEVILRLYEQDPENVEEHLAGMWAFAIHDRGRRRVVLSRDRFGIKPLFLADTGGALAFASELQCFDRSLEPFTSLFEVDRAAAHAMLSWSYVPETATIYRGVKRLRPGSRLTIDLASGKRTHTTYFQLRPSSDAARVRSLDEACETTEELLRRAVKEHLESDVPVATFLSGGVDSSLVSAYARDLTPDAVKAYTIGFDEKRFDESPFARATAAKLGVPIETETFNETRARERLADAMLSYDEPFGDSSSLAVFLLSQRVARDYKVALGGDGGDEAFAGYKKHRIVRVRGALNALPGARDVLGKALARLPAYNDRTRSWTELLRTARRLSRGLAGTAPHAYVQLTQVASLAHTAPLIAGGATDALDFEAAALARFDAAIGTELQRTLASDLGNVLPNDMLVKVDRASMRCHLEARVPFLDHRVVEWGLGLAPEFTVGGRVKDQGKRVLRALHERRFGPELARRKKQGFNVPVERWLRGPFGEACEQLFETKRLDRLGILSSAALGNGGHRRWLETDPIIVWHAFALAVWCEANLGAGHAAVRDILGRCLRQS